MTLILGQAIRENGVVPLGIHGTKDRFSVPNPLRAEPGQVREETHPSSVRLLERMSNPSAMSTPHFQRRSRPAASGDPQ